MWEDAPLRLSLSPGRKLPRQTLIRQRLLTPERCSLLGAAPRVPRGHRGRHEPTDVITGAPDKQNAAQVASGAGMTRSFGGRLRLAGLVRVRAVIGPMLSR